MLDEALWDPDNEAVWQEKVPGENRAITLRDPTYPYPGLWTTTNPDDLTKIAAASLRMVVGKFGLRRVGRVGPGRRRHHRGHPRRAPAAAMRAKETFASRSPEDTQAIGAGKTCFLQGLARGLGVQAGVTSPTFVLINHYRGRLPVYHVDAFRTESLTELVDLGVEELVHGDGVTVVEWADKLLPLLPPHAITVTITGLGDEPRQITLQGPVSPVARAESVPGG
jgi:tRNA threonylcarbamoyl adenosine modification protein YjeE